jgi:hypothetical protein
MSFVEGKGLFLTQPLYDTVQIPAAGVLASFFTVPRGGALTAAINKDDRHTNLVQAGRLELGNSFEIRAISLNVRHSVQAGALPIVADIKAVSSGSFRLIIGGQTEAFKIPTAYIPSGGADFVHMSNIAAAATEFNLSRGVAVTQNRYMLEEVINIQPQESFEVRLENMDAIAAATQVAVMLWGVLLRPVR